jgi:carboxylesterase type B
VTKANLTAFAYRYATPLPGYDIAWHSVDNWLMFLGTSTGSELNSLSYSELNADPIPRFNGTTTFNALSPTETAFASEIIAYWLSFVKHGDPNVSKLARSPIWPAYSTQERLVLDKHPRSADQSGVQKEKQPEDTVVRCNHAVALVDREQN